MMPVRRVKAQPRVWPLSTEPPPWVWTMPSAAGLCTLSSTPHATLLTSARPPPPPPPPPPPLRAVTSWQLSCDPFLPPLISPLPVPNVQWELTSRPPMLGFQHSAGVDLVPVFPVVYRTVLQPHYGKSWLEKRRPDYKVYLNNALETWIGPEEVGIFQHQEKPVLMANQVAMSISRPTAASRNFHTLLLTPRRISGCPVAIKRVRSNKRMALATAALVAMESEMAQRPSASSAHPVHLLSFSPIKIPLLTSPNPGPRSTWEGLLSPVLPTQLTAMRALSAPAVTLLTGDWKDKKAPEKKLEMRKPSCTGALVLHSDSTPEDKVEDEQFQISLDIDNSSKDKRPVASTPVPGSPWCVVWTGDDRVFFFNPTMQLSVWEKPVDLKDRGDLNKIIEDPPHKRKKDMSEDSSNSPSADDEDEGDEEGDHILKSKRNKMEEPSSNSVSASEEQNTERCTASNQMILPLELRITHFREMLLERGVSAFSTWEKELHKIVFDPRYLLLGPEERKQIFDQFAKARIKEEYKERKNKLQQAKEEFRKLLEESKITSNPQNETRSELNSSSYPATRSTITKPVLNHKGSTGR
ncbi:transcription elongation regulator 1-like protein isoform X2 [Tachysurus fulvidraco]|uniref:transcription elongation regulator 1-like protein isoform X2 n=1 Tax=Tachysurus fulvidraco TaxID=1234273 RepID=UPI001FF05ACE|nr:transcription elongation regulator 1-like protein isoform X2 [Tachysurus fulvidraco]